MLPTALLLLATTLACKDDPLDTGTAGGGDGGTEVEDSGWTEQPYDAYWGDAPDLETRLELYDELWEGLREDYACFGASGVDWDALYEQHRPRVEAATSYGRWYRLLDEHFRALQDGHAMLWSTEVCGTPLTQRPPVFWHADTTSLLGACVAPQPDDTLLVYRVEEGNAAGLQPGDRLVGYDGRPWRELVDEIEASGLPWCAVHASADSAEDAVRMKSMVYNAHLYDSLEYIPAGATEALSLPTEDLLTRSGTLLCSDQLIREDVLPPWTGSADYGAGPGISHGVIEGDIGLVYTYAWTSAETEPFGLAIAELLEAGVRGIVLDHRYNIGGGSGAALDGVDLLFDQPVERIMNCAVRDDASEDITALDVTEGGWHAMDPDPSSAFEGPIAILTGPKSLSAGDLVPYYLSFYDNVRRFGASTNGSFGAMTYLWDGSSPADPDDLYVSYTYAACVDADLDFLQGAEIPPEVELWLEPEDVAAGRDTVLEAALVWIDEQTLR